MEGSVNTNFSLYLTGGKHANKLKNKRQTRTDIVYEYKYSVVTT